MSSIWLTDQEIENLIFQHNANPRQIYIYNKTPNQYLTSLIEDETKYKEFVKKYCNDIVYKFTTRLSYYCLERMRYRQDPIPQSVIDFEQYKMRPELIIKEIQTEENLKIPENLKKQIDLISKETGQIIEPNNKIVGDKYYWFLKDEQISLFTIDEIHETINEIYDIQGLNEFMSNDKDEILEEYNFLRRLFIGNTENYIVDITIKNENLIENESNILTIYLNENDYIDIDMSTLTAEQFAEILKNAIREGMIEARQPQRQQEQEQQGQEQQEQEQQEEGGIPAEEEEPMGMSEFQEAMAKSQLGVAQGIHALAQATAMNKMSDFMNEYRGMTREELINEYEKFGVNYIQNSKEEESTEDLLRKIDFMKSLKKQSEVLADLKYNRKSTVEEGYNRITWDMFEKLSNEKLKNGTPFETIIKYIQGIPNSKIKFSKDDGKFNVIQEKDSQKFNTYKEAKRFAESGSFYSRDLRILRKINNEFEKKKKMYDIVWNARTY